MTVRIDGVDYAFDGEKDSDKTLVEYAHNNGIEIPTLCFLKDCMNVGKCGLCSVMNVVDGESKKGLACRLTVEDGVEFITVNGESEESVTLKEGMKDRVAKLLDKHYFMCGKCPRKGSCEFLKLVMFTKAKANERYNPEPEIMDSRIDSRSKSLVIDRNRCVSCGRCVATCVLRTGTESITLGKLPEEIADSSGLSRAICPALKEVVTIKNEGLPDTTAPNVELNEKGKPAVKTVAQTIPFDETNCILCGQCTLACPTAALKEQDHIERVEDALADENKHVVFAIAPSIRASLGESFGLGYGVDVTGKIYTGLRELGADKVFDINFAADMTIMEEGTELLQRLGIVPGLEGEAKFPMFTSCCPGWVRLVDNFAPELKPYLSSAKSPQQMFGAAAKYYYPKIEGLNPEDVYVVSVMPCIAKKYEAQRDGMFGADGNENDPDIDAVLTSRELAQMFKKHKIKLEELEDSEVDPAMGEYTGAGTIFGVTGGVMEAAIRTAADLASGQDIQNVDYCQVEGFEGVREAEIELQLKDKTVKTLKVAVVNGAANFFELQKSGKLSGYHFIEVMACPGGCINGGGQPHVNSHEKMNYAKDKDGNFVSGHFAGTGDYLPEYVQKRASVLRNQDRKGNWTNKKRKSHENQAVLKMYQYLETEPGVGLAHHLFHLS
ncbi:MAG: [FeFe] hydrogenase, group A [Candidatus Ancillula sp.]|jgi:NADH-quinone oxidoreductase subunit G|nr:[FeFe] hydrogenase, group A [Candidatus Ancillula sp.]